MYGSLSCWPFPLLRQPSLLADPGSVTQDLRLARLEDELLNRLERLGFGSQDEPRSGRQAVGLATLTKQERSETCKSAWSSLRDGSLRHVCKQITNIKSSSNVWSFLPVNLMCLPSILTRYPVLFNATFSTLFTFLRSLSLAEESRLNDLRRQRAALKANSKTKVSQQIDYMVCWCINDYWILALSFGLWHFWMSEF